MVDFAQTVNAPQAASMTPPKVSSDWIGQLYNDFVNSQFDQQKKQLNQQSITQGDQQTQLNAQRIQQGQQQAQLARAFPNGLPIDQSTGQVDYRAVASTLAKFGDVGSAVNVMGQQPSAPPPLIAGGASAPQQQQQAPQSQPTSIPAPPLPAPAANAPQGDAAGSVISRVTDALPPGSDKIGVVAGNMAKALKVDPNAPLSPQQVAKLDGFLAPYKKAGDDASGGTMPPSLVASSPAPPPAPPQQQRAPIGAGSGAPAAPPPQAAPVPQAAPPQAPQQQQPQQQQPQTPLVPQEALPKGYTDPQKAIADLRADAARLAGNPKMAGYAKAEMDKADRIEKSITPIQARPGETYLDPRSGRIVAQVPPQSRANPVQVEAIADAIASGHQPPKLTGLYSMSAPVRAALEERGFDLSKAQLEYTRAEKQIQALNGPQMTRFVGLASSVDKTIDEVRELSEQMQNSGIPLLNKGKLERYIQLQGNSENGQLATRYIAATNTLKEEFANLAQGGYAPTEPVWELANKQINADFGVKQMGASLEEIQRLIRYRINAIPGINTMGPGAANRYTGQGAPAQQPSQPAPASPAPQSQQNATPGGNSWSYAQ